MSAKTRQISLLTLRVVLGIVFLFSSIGKLINSGDARYLVELMATKFYWLIEYTGPIVLGITIFELLLAVMLLWGKKIRWTLSISLLLIVFFSGVLSYFYVQGFGIKTCGCFGAFDIGGGITFGLFKNLILIILIAGALFLSRDKKIIHSAPVKKAVKL
jgi:uncharacterized membrane protein YphA (DoxX/SURF4 family)